VEPLIRRMWPSLNQLWSKYSSIILKCLILTALTVFRFLFFLGFVLRGVVASQTVIQFVVDVFGGLVRIGAWGRSGYWLNDQLIVLNSVIFFSTVLSWFLCQL
jgi:hypothetical protein